MENPKNQDLNGQQANLKALYGVKVYVSPIELILKHGRDITNCG
jgi:hypothetical protein